MLAYDCEIGVFAISVQEQKKKAGQGRKEEMSVYVLLNACAISRVPLLAHRLVAVLDGMVPCWVVGFFAFGRCVISGCIGFKTEWSGRVWILDVRKMSEHDG